MGVPWPEGFVGRSLRNRFTEAWGRREAGQPATMVQLSAVTERGDYDVAFGYAEQAVGLVEVPTYPAHRGASLARQWFRLASMGAVLNTGRRSCATDGRWCPAHSGGSRPGCGTRRTVSTDTTLGSSRRAPAG